MNLPSSNQAWLDRRQYPFSPHFFALPAGRMHYVDEGRGAPVVMVHGNPTWSFLYRHLISRLRTRHRCVAPDHIGFGLSDKPAEFNHRPWVHARHFTALMEHLDLHDVTLVVHDWGGPIGLYLAIEQPERIRRIVLLNTWMWSLRRDPYYVAFSTFAGGPIGRHLTRTHNFFARVVMKRVYGDPSRLTEEIHRHYLRPLATPADRTGSALLPKQMVAASDWLAHLWSRRSALDPFPKLVVWGMKDPGFRLRELARWASAFPDAQVLALPDVGHYVQEEAPERLGAAVERFLST